MAKQATEDKNQQPRGTKMTERSHMYSDGRVEPESILCIDDSTTAEDEEQNWLDLWGYETDPDPIRMSCLDPSSKNIAVWEELDGHVGLTVVPGEDFKQRMGIIFHPRSVLHLNDRLGDVLDRWDVVRSERIFRISGGRSNLHRVSDTTPYAVLLKQTPERRLLMDVEVGDHKQTYALPRGWSETEVHGKALTGKQSAYITLGVCRQ